MKIIRNQAFETNSSSAHTITIDVQSEKFDNFPHVFTDELEKRYLIVELGEFGWLIEKHTDAPTKLSYIFTSFKNFIFESDFYVKPLGDDPDMVTIDLNNINYDHPNALGVVTVLTAIMDVLMVDYIVVDAHGWNYIDHQSRGVIETIIMGGVENVKNFIFKSGSLLITSNDNISDEDLLPEEIGLEDCI